MDIYCSICAEPWDMDSLHEEIDLRKSDGRMPATTNQAEYDPLYSQVRNEFATKGCRALSYAYPDGDGWCKPSTDPKAQFRAELAAAMYDLMGDDLDGVASIMDDYDHMGVI
jgi:hypothetical protein